MRAPRDLLPVAAAADERHSKPQERPVAGDRFWDDKVEWDPRRQQQRDQEATLSPSSRQLFPSVSAAPAEQTR